jgi:hypothetical protein
MTERVYIILASDKHRRRAKSWIDQAADDTRLEFKGPKRSLPQNDRQWLLLTQVATQVTYHGRRLSTGQWKRLFMQALNREADLVPSLDGVGLCDISDSSSDLSKQEHCDFTAIIEAWGAEHGVDFDRPSPKQAVREMLKASVEEAAQ